MAELFSSILGQETLKLGTPPYLPSLVMAVWYPILGYDTVALTRGGFSSSFLTGQITIPSAVPIDLSFHAVVEFPVSRVMSFALFVNGLIATSTIAVAYGAGAGAPQIVSWNTTLTGLSASDTVEIRMHGNGTSLSPSFSVLELTARANG
jgi:hypothetical protein